MSQPSDKVKCLKTLLAGKRGQGTFYYQLTSRGFASEINNLIFGVLHALDTGKRFSLDSSMWVAAHEEGWSDYFEPFCGTHAVPFIRIGSAFTVRDSIRKKQQLYRLTHPKALYTNEFVPSLNADSFANRIFEFPELGISGDVFAAASRLAELIFRYKNSIQTEIESALTDMPRNYAALHVRRGDKLVSEAKLTDTRRYVEAVRQSKHELDAYFVSTDDYSVVEELRSLYPNCDFRTNCSPTARGYQQSDFNASDPAYRRKEMLVLMVDLEMLTRADLFVGTFSSNIGRFVALRRGLENSISLDGDWHVA